MRLTFISEIDPVLKSSHTERQINYFFHLVGGEERSLLIKEALARYSSYCLRSPFGNFKMETFQRRGRSERKNKINYEFPPFL